MNKNLILVLVVLAIGVGLVFFYSRSIPATTAVTSTPVSTSTDLNTPVSYQNPTYGFTFTLPATWRGFTIVETTWNGMSASGSASTSGPKILIRNPKWTATAPYEDLPVLVFTLAQWDSYVAEKFSVSAAPIQATELARNNAYVFALPPRWDFDYSTGVKEAEDIIASKPLIANPVQTVSAPQAKLNINVVCQKALEYMKFADAKSTDAFVKDCIDGKHPEVIEKYKSDLNLGAGVAI